MISDDFVVVVVVVVADLPRFYVDFEIHATSSDGLSVEAQKRIDALVAGEANCYSYVDMLTNQYEFQEADCGVFLPSVCKDGKDVGQVQNGTCAYLG